MTALDSAIALPRGMADFSIGKITVRPDFDGVRLKARLSVRRPENGVPPLDLKLELSHGTILATARDELEHWLIDLLFRAFEPAALILKEGAGQSLAAHPERTVA